MRKIILAAIAAIGAQTASASSLVVEAIDGTSQTYPMESVSRVDFTTAGSLKVVKIDGSADTKSISTTRRIVFTGQTSPSTAASEASASGSELKVFPNPVSNELTVVGAEGDILLFAAAGNLILKTKADEKTVIPVGSLANGIYVLRNGDNAVKVIKSK